MEVLKRADRDLVSLTVLALLFLGPRHTYDMHRQMILTHKDFVVGLPRSMYHAVNRLLKAGHIAVHDTQRSPHRPERTLYRLTDAGLAELRARMGRLLSIPDSDAKLYIAALSFLGVMPIADAEAALQRRVTTLTQHLAAVDKELSTLQLPRLLLVETEFDRARLTAERDWTGRIVAELRDGRLDWPQDADGLRALGGDADS